MTERYALVALPLPLATPYTYRIPDTLGDRVVPGTRVVVPVRRRELIGIAVAVDVTAPPARPRTCLPCRISSRHCLRRCWPRRSGLQGTTVRR